MQELSSAKANRQAPYPAAAGIARRITTVYIIFGGLWILFSDQVMAYFFRDPKILVQTSMYKGWLFIAMTGVLLFFLVRNSTRRYLSQQELLHQAEEHYRATFIQAGVGIAHLAPEGQVLRVNRRLSDITGFSEAELLTRTFQDITHPSDLAADLAGRRQLLDGTITTYSLEKRYLRKNGSLVWVNCTEALVRKPSGEPAYFISVIEDINDHHAAKESLQRSEERYRSTLDHMMEGCQIIGFDWRYLYINNAAQVHNKRRKEEMLGQSFLDIWPGIDQTPVFACIRRCLEERESGQLEHFFVFPSGSQGWFELSVQPVPEGAFILSMEITAKKQAAIERERLLSAVEQAGEMIVMTNPAGVIQYVNPAFERITGYAREDALGKTPRILKSGKHDAEFYRQLWRTISAGKPWQGRLVNKRKDGSIYTEEATIAPVCDDTGTIFNYVAVKRDISASLHMENQFRQAQKMETVGRLAGGVAHDYNNMLSVILGYAELAITRVEASSPLYTFLDEILTATKRSAAITRQLLAFARQQTIVPQVFELNELVDSMLKMMRRLIGEDIELVWKPGNTKWPVRMDMSQLDQILANLCVNARDAISGSGRITIETGVVTLDDAYCFGQDGFQPGEFILLIVSDDGCGMDKEVLDQVFEPFFTTKEQGKGTGLGLATVYGIVRQNNGFINVYSEPNRGTSFKVYLPPHFGEVEPIEDNNTRKIARGHGETILVVEDEKAIMQLTERILKELGYVVLAAGSPGVALSIVKENAGKIDLLVTDVIMPEMTGRELCDQLSAFMPKMKTLFMSGYTADVIAHQGVLEEGMHFLQKPFNKRELAEKVHQALAPSLPIVAE